ncbi:MAG: zinc-ribbon domain-containing protein [Clostridia bacterium]|nr:zinc-ribbon domain-containing protein [Clostridia bacterium]
MICPKCGKELRDTAQLCIHCGSILKRRDGVVSVAGTTPDRVPAEAPKVAPPIPAPTPVPPQPTPAPAQPTPTSEPTKRRKKKRAPLWPVVLILAAIAIVIGLLIWHPWRVDNAANDAETLPTVDRSTVITTLPEVLPTTTLPPTTQPIDPALTPPGYDKTAKAFLDDGILVMGDSAFECYNYIESDAERYAAAINRTAATLQGASRVYDMVVPLAIGVCVDESIRRDIAESDDEKESIEQIYQKLSPSVMAVRSFDAMKQAADRQEYLYFRSDTHWTALGAYRAYEQWAATIGVSAVPLSDFKEHRFPGYLGYLDAIISDDTAMAANPDVVYAYEPSQTNTITVTNEYGDTYEGEIVSDQSDSDYQYMTFICGDNPISKIVNPTLPEGTSCVLVKESYGNAFAPYLVAHYHTVYIVDLRYFSQVYSGKLSDFVIENRIGDVLFLYNLSATRNGDMIDALDAMC